MMMLAAYHPTQAARVALNLISAAFQRGIGLCGQLASLHAEVPMAGFIGMHNGHTAYVLYGKLYEVNLCALQHREKITRQRSNLRKWPKTS